MVTGIVLPAEAEQSAMVREFSQLADYQAVVGGLIEAVDLPGLGVTIYINDEGLLQHLPFNSRASFLWWYHVPETRQRAMLVGDAIVVGLPDRNGDTTSVPDTVRHMLTGAGLWRVEVRTVGDPKWYGNQARYDDYFDAILSAMLTLERWTAAEETRVLPAAPIPATGSTA